MFPLVPIIYTLIIFNIKSIFVWSKYEEYMHTLTRLSSSVVIILAISTTFLFEIWKHIAIIVSNNIHTNIAISEPIMINSILIFFVFVLVLCTVLVLFTSFDGSIVGSIVGVLLGITVGVPEGVLLGYSEGLCVWYSDGVILGICVGYMDGDNVDAVGVFVFIVGWLVLMVGFMAVFILKIYVSLIPHYLCIFNSTLDCGISWYHIIKVDLFTVWA